MDFKISKLAVVLLMTLVIFFTGLTGSTFAQDQQFMATLSGQEEVPPTNTPATGAATFVLRGDNLTFSVDASDIEPVTAGHIHYGKQGENGPIVVTLIQNETDVEETGSITPDQLRGQLAGKQLSELITAMNNGQTYVNLHTDLNPNGEIRGQIVSASQTLAQGTNATAVTNPTNATIATANTSNAGQTTEGRPPLFG